MSTVQMSFLVLVFVVVVAGCLGLAALFRPNAARERLQGLDRQGRGPAPAGARLVDMVARVTRPISKLSMPEEGFEKSSLKLRFLHAGIRGSSASTAFFGFKTVLSLALPMIAFAGLVLAGSPVKGNGLLLIVLGLAGAGYYLPNVVLGRMVMARQREIFEAFPDALDLLTVCIEAGLGTEAGMMRVAEDLQFNSPALADELRIVNLELRAGLDRERALRNLAMRTGVEEVEAFVTMISQAERFGTSIADSLRVHSDMLRTRRRQRAEEAAAKIALKLLFPLIFCIFPALMVALMGPAVIQVVRVLLPAMGGH